MRCLDCQVDYPPALLAHRGDLLLCGICALARTNAALPEVRRKTRFASDLAEARRKDAVEWRRQTKQAPHVRNSRNGDGREREGNTQ